MPDELKDSASRAPVDMEIIDRIAAHLDRNARVEDVLAPPAYAPNAAVAEYNRGYFPGGVRCAYLQMRWFEMDDFRIHYAEQYRTDILWECRWDRHPNQHKTRDHFHLHRCTSARCGR